MVAKERTSTPGLRVLILRLGPVAAPVEEAVAASLPAVLGVTCESGGEVALPPWAYMASRRQYDSSEILRWLARRVFDADRVLGITAADLTLPILSHLFGEAELPGRAAVFSLHRLCPSFYGLPPDPRQLCARACKEAAHELGHTFGLHHCRDASCLMHAADSVERTDVKRGDFCAACKARLEEALR